MNNQYIQRIEKIEERLQELLPNHPASAWMDATFAAIPQSRLEMPDPLLEPALDMLFRGGKRWRPLLATLICEALGGGDAALPLVPLVELPHNASLIHDDIEDNSDERRGKPAVHLIYGLDAAINSGCFLYFLPLRCIDEWDAPEDLKSMLYARWGEYMRRLHLGQSIDIYWHTAVRIIPSLADYYQMCALKTGCLARFAAILGGYAGFAHSWGTVQDRCAEAIAALGMGAEKIGVGFQILDDVKNLTEGNPGKKRGDDIVEGKKSLPILLLLSRYTDSISMVERCFAAARTQGPAAPEVEELIAEMEERGVLEDAAAQGEGLIAEGQEMLRGYFLDHPLDGQHSPKEAQEAQELLFGIVDLIR